MNKHVKVTGNPDETSELTESDISGFTPKADSRPSPMSGDGDPYKDLPLSKLH